MLGNLGLVGLSGTNKTSVINWVTERLQRAIRGLKHSGQIPLNDDDEPIDIITVATEGTPEGLIKKMAAIEAAGGHANVLLVNDEMRAFDRSFLNTTTSQNQQDTGLSMFLRATTGNPITKELASGRIEVERPILRVLCEFFFSEFLLYFDSCFSGSFEGLRD